MEKKAKIHKIHKNARDIFTIFERETSMCVTHAYTIKLN